MTSIFPLIKRFQDIKKSPNSVILTEEVTIHEKCFRSGTVFQILGWREINDRAYLVLVKGSWEGLADYEDFSKKIEAIEGIG
jgi:hypothetical protein